MGPPQYATVQPPARRGGEVERTTFGDNQARPCRSPRQGVTRVAAVMADGGVECAIELRQGRYLEDDRSAFGEHLAQRRQRGDIVFDVLQNIEHDDRIERPESRKP